MEYKLEANNIELLTHIVEFMSSKDIIEKIFTEHNLRFRKGKSYKELAKEIENNPIEQ